MTHRAPLMLSADENRAIRAMLTRTGAATTPEGRDLMHRLEEHFGPAFRGATTERNHVDQDQRSTDSR